MAKLEYAKDGRLLFTKEMRDEGYTILAPNMLPMHFKLFQKAFALHGYNIIPLETMGREIINEGLKNVHNDTCYPALLVIGQLIHALKSGKYDPNKTALMITQTGRRMPCVELHLPAAQSTQKKRHGKHPGYFVEPVRDGEKPRLSADVFAHQKIGLQHRLRRFAAPASNQTRPYELVEGDTDRMIEQWVETLSQEYKSAKNVTYRRVKQNLDRILKDFASIPTDRSEEKIRVGIVGEIYVKYSPLGNNNLEEFLRSEDVEVVLPGLMDFVIFKVDNRKVDPTLYGGNHLKHAVASWFENYLIGWEDDMIEAVKKYPQFRPPARFSDTKELVKNYMGYGNKMGEGWLLTGEMLELVHSGCENVVCTQPFGCLPNHVAGKGMIRKIRENNPNANIVAIDYDPGATAINQENRIKLKIANARRMKKLEAKEAEKKSKKAPAKAKKTAKPSRGTK